MYNKGDLKKWTNATVVRRRKKVMEKHRNITNSCPRIHNPHEKAQKAALIIQEFNKTCPNSGLAHNSM